jgi:hypothetical protein
MASRPPPDRQQWAWDFRWLSPEAPAIQAFRPPRLSSPLRTNRVEGAMEVDEFGQVTHVLLDPVGTAIPDRKEILQALRTIRAERGMGPMRLRFRLALESKKEGP